MGYKEYMKIYKIAPILSFSPFFTLTYVGSDEFEIGNLVPIDFNKREILGIVLEKFNLKDAKVEIRKADFKTKKIEKHLPENQEHFFPTKLLEVFFEFSKNFAIPVGEIIYFVYGDFPGSFPPFLPLKEEKMRTVNTGNILAYYPDDLSLKISENENALKGADIFKIILAGNEDELIIKDFNFDKYINFQSPHISKLDLLFSILKMDGLLLKKITLETDFLGVVETAWLNDNVKKVKNKNLLFDKIEIEIKETKNIAKKYLVKVGKDANGEEQVLAEEVIKKILPNEKVFMFVLSHGYADRIFCNDCHKSYDCENCGTGFSLLNEDGENILRYLYCKKCKNKKTLKDDQYVICKNCGSWRIFPFGIGGQKVLESLLPLSIEGEGGAKVHNNNNLILIDESEKKLSVKKITEQVKEFLERNPNLNNGEVAGANILIGSLRTLKVLQNLPPYRTGDKQLIDKSVIVSTGPLVKGKFFDSDEKLVRLISQVENISTSVYINKREGDEISLENYKDKEKFVKDELTFRKSAGLPPFKKVLSLVFNYKNKRFVDKFIMQNFEDWKTDGEIKRGNTFIYYWFISSPGEGQEQNFRETLRQFGDVVIANSVYEQSNFRKK